MNRLTQSKLNPVKFVEVSPSQAAQFHSKNMDEWAYVDTIEFWMEQRSFFQQWQKNDTISIQFQSNYGPITISVIDENETVFTSFLLAQLQTDPTTGLSIQQGSFSPASLSEGVYFLKATATGLALISEPLDIRTTHEDTLLLTYASDEFYEDIIFKNTSFAPTLRTPGKLRYKQPASKSTQYEDQRLNMKVLDKVPYRIIELIIGGPEGVPDYFIDKIDRILGCSTLSIDGYGYAQVDGKWEEVAEENYPMRGWRTDLREALNRASVIYDNDEVVTGVAVVVANVNSKGFGTSTGGNIYPVNDIG
jgi:hypothetical protein